MLIPELQPILILVLWMCCLWIEAPCSLTYLSNCIHEHGMFLCPDSKGLTIKHFLSSYFWRERCVHIKRLQLFVKTMKKLIWSENIYR